jgi:spore coat assembly protein
MFNIGDYVTRNSYNNDIVFKIINIKNNIYYLKGVSVRLYADSEKEDLVICDYLEEDEKLLSVSAENTM